MHHCLSLGEDARGPLKGKAVMRHGIVLVLVGLAVSSVVRLGAHHAIGRFYDERRTITIEGDVERVLHQVPHSSVHLAWRTTEAARERGRWSSTPNTS